MIHTPLPWEWIMTDPALPVPQESRQRNMPHSAAAEWMAFQAGDARFLRKK